MPINPAIALGVQSPQFESPMNMMAQMMQVKGAQEASQLNALKLQQAQREVEQQNMLGQAYQSAFDPEKGTINYNKLMSQLAGGGAGAQIPGILKGRREAENADVEAQTKKVKLLTDTLATVPEMYKRAATPDDLLAVHNYVHSNPVLGPWLQSIGATPEKGLATLQAAAQTPEGLAQYRQQAMSSVSQILDAAKPLVVAPSASVFAGGKFAQAPAAPEKAAAPPAMVAEYTFAKTPEGGGYVGSFEKFVRDRAIAARPPGAPRQEAAPVAVVDPATGKQIFVSREEALRNRMTPASAMENLAPKEIQKREAALPQATSAVQGFESKSDKFIADLMALRDHPGLSSITGIAAGRMPGLTSEGRAAQALYDKVVAKGGFQALQDLRDASKTGGALGNVSNQEGKQLTASFAAIDRRQDAPDVKAAIDQAIADIQGTKTRMREAYDATYSYKSGATPATPPAVVPSKAGGPAMPAKPGANLTPAEQAELEQLRQRFRK